MPKTLPVNIIKEKNKLTTESRWLALLNVTLTDSTKLYLVNGTENIWFPPGVQEYTAFPFNFDALKSETGGQLVSLQLSVCNADRIMQSYIENTDPPGGIGSSIEMIIVNSDYLAEDYTEQTWEFNVTGCKADSKYVYFTLGDSNIFIRRFPLGRYMANNCRYVANFKDVECASTDPSSSCKGTLEDCQMKLDPNGNVDNSKRFGGFRGLDSGGLRVV